MKMPVRTAFGRHPRLAILGPLEARLQRFDLVVLGGLNEGAWPRSPGTYASGKHTISAPCAAASDIRLRIFSRASSRVDATRGDASATIRDRRLKRHPPDRL